MKQWVKEMMEDQPGKGLKEQKQVGDPTGDEQWQPAAVLDQLDIDDEFRSKWRLKWVRSGDRKHMRRMEQEGWSLVSRLETGDKIEHNSEQHLSGWINDPAKMSETYFVERELVLMKLPMARYLKRKEYYDNEANERIEAVTKRNRPNAAGGGEITGSVKIMPPGERPRIIQ